MLSSFPEAPPGPAYGGKGEPGGTCAAMVGAAPKPAMPDADVGGAADCPYETVSPGNALGGRRESSEGVVIVSGGC